MASFLATSNGPLALLIRGTVVDDLEIVLLPQMRQSLDQIRQFNLPTEDRLRRRTRTSNALQRPPSSLWSMPKRAAGMVLWISVDLAS